MQVPQELKKAPMWLKALVIAGIPLLLAPVMFWALKGLATLVILGAIGFFALLALHFGPVIADKIANAALGAKKAEWAKNPIETLQRQYVEKVKALHERRDNLKSFLANVDNVKSHNDTYISQFPQNKDKIAILQATYNKLRKLGEVKSSKYKAAKEAVEKFEVAIQEADLFWQAAQAANAASQMDDSDSDPMELLRTKTSLGSVQDQLGIAFSELDVALLEQVKDVDGIVIDVTPKTPERVALK